MRFPETSLDYAGRTVPVEKLTEIGGVPDGVAFYRERGARRFYAVFHNYELTTEEAVRELSKRRGGAGVFMPRDKAEIDALQNAEVLTLELNERALLETYVREFSCNELIEKLLLEAVREFVPRAERAGKAPVTAWLTRRVAVLLAARAEIDGHTMQEQLALFAEQAVDSGQKRRRAVKRARQPKGECDSEVQLELATALVEVVVKLSTRPSVEALSHAQRTASALHRSLHAEETFRRISAA